MNPEMQLRLQAAERVARANYAALPPERREESFEAWAAVRGPHLCWRPYAGQHSAGAAIDIDPAANPYIVTRNGPVPGGEAGGETLVDMRNRALAAYDRAVRFTTQVPAADVSGRHPNESTESVWTRFKSVSDALVRYFSPAINPQVMVIERVAIENADEVSDEELLATIPQDERIPLDQTDVTPVQYLRMLRDYEHARIPMVIGSPSATPERTRNPARGFLKLQCEIVTALCDQGLRWGACDLEISADGSSHNGAMMHFDLADNGGYPEIDSLLRFG
ncbi:MAG: hypothetical protein ACREML_07965 [Vulcanimicrobiaceae bacterium]